ncbi:MAG: hypothetical protein P8L41_08845 [Paracoccaceae bacterium]|nr:hypothetical protein [Paracoccaceae bacterium]
MSLTLTLPASDNLEVVTWGVQGHWGYVRYMYTQAFINFEQYEAH